MSQEPSSFSGAARARLYREQLLTTDDLQAFKAELLEEIGRLLAQGAAEAPKKWLKSPDVRKLLGISPGTLQNLRINGTLPFTRLGGVLLYDAADIEKLLEKNRQRGALLVHGLQDRPAHASDRTNARIQGSPA
ncbi:helix-turn-helix domain-containing protein [Cesiribacter andamanensis]|uniref:Helix-turn-helix domain protein n=1 Tax=Cesiribacter andamanensis AMV16 TaxID=1279009 RepID=M7NL72_9BACT|nr:helix-turn-helix domain-containing protein [Cesiribacter andamanensis]EMR02545.1 Helix-turn-helix domain protein [Cesiribacter andamanensis AMV16]